MPRTTLTVCALVALGSQVVLAQGKDVQFVLLGKTRNYRQVAPGDVRFLNSVFFGEIFLNEGGKVSRASVTGPGEAERGLFFGDEDVPFLAGTRHTSTELLEEQYPDGIYYVSFDTPHGNVDKMPVRLSRQAGGSPYPSPIEITLHQHGRVAAPGAIDPNADLRVTWSAFERGAADPNGIIDDMIYVIMGNCLGVKTIHSGRAFAVPSLTYTAKEFVIPRESLRPGQAFQIEVEFSDMQTSRPTNLIAITTYAASTFLDIQTTGTDESHMDCPEQPLAMDGGQTDRRKKPH